MCSEENVNTSGRFGYALFMILLSLADLTRQEGFFWTPIFLLVLFFGAQFSGEPKGRGETGNAGLKHSWVQDPGPQKPGAVKIPL